MKLAALNKQEDMTNAVIEVPKVSVARVVGDTALQARGNHCTVMLPSHPVYAGRTS